VKRFSRARAGQEETMRERYVQVLLDRVREERYPSSTYMDMIEASLSTPEQLVEYLETLLEKVESTRFPSLQMLRRIQRITTALPR
jgi:hypothetical protein